MTIAQKEAERGSGSRGPEELLDRILGKVEPSADVVVVVIGDLLQFIITALSGASEGGRRSILSQGADFLFTNLVKLALFHFCK